MLVLASRFGAGQRGYAVSLLNGRHFYRRDRHSAFAAVLRLVRTVRQIKAVKIPAYVEFFVLRIDQLQFLLYHFSCIFSTHKTA